MATYAELRSASEDSVLINKVRVACVIAAEAVRSESDATLNNANRLIWAKSVFQNPDAGASPMLWVVLAQNKAATLAQIIGASDAAVQTAVDSAINVFATGAQ